MRTMRALGALVLTTLTLTAAAAAAAPAVPNRPAESAGPAGPSEAERWIGPGERFVVPGQPRTVVRLTRHAVVVRTAGASTRAPVPAGPAPELAARPVLLGQAGEGYLVRQEGGDSTAWTLFVPLGGRLRAASEPRRPDLDGGFRADGSHTRTWITRYDGLRSERTWPDGRRKVWTWAVAGPGEGGIPVPDEPEPGSLVATRVR